MHKLWSSDLSVTLCLLPQSARSTSQVTCNSRLFVNHIIYLTSFQAVKSHLETTLGSPQCPFAGSRARHANKSQASHLSSRAEAGTSRCIPDTSMGTAPLNTLPSETMLWWLGFGSKSLWEEHTDKIETDLDLKSLKPSVTSQSSNKKWAVGGDSSVKNSLFLWMSVEAVETKQELRGPDSAGASQLVHLWTDSGNGGGHGVYRDGGQTNTTLFAKTHICCSPTNSAGCMIRSHVL